MTDQEDKAKEEENEIEDARLKVVVRTAIVLGSAIVFGIYQTVYNARKWSNVPGNLDFSNLLSYYTGMYSVALGYIRIALAIFGCCAAHLKWRSLLIVFAVLSIVDVIISIILLKCIGSSYQKVAEDLVHTMTLAFRKYGNESSQTASNNFTKAIDDFSLKKSCCGWGLTDAENLYMISDWYHRVNAGRSERPQILPESCCTTKDKDLCIRATSLWVARTDGYTHKQSCTDAALDGSGTQVVILRTSYVIIITMSVLTAHSTVKFVHKLFRRGKSSTDERASNAE